MPITSRRLHSRSGSKSMRPLAGSATTPPHTGTTSETAILTIPLAGLGDNDQIQARLTLAATNNANAKTIRVRLGGIGGTIMCAGTFTSQANARGGFVIANKGATNIQFGAWQAIQNITATTSSNTATRDTAAGVDLVVTIELANATDSATITSFDAVRLTP